MIITHQERETLSKREKRDAIRKKQSQLDANFKDIRFGTLSRTEFRFRTLSRTEFRFETLSRSNLEQNFDDQVTAD